MSKWQISEASIGRIRESVEAASFDEATGDPWGTLMRAVKAEDYASPRRVAEQIAVQWVRDGVLGHFCAYLFDSICHERNDLREAGSNIMDGIRSFGRMRL